MSGEWCQYLVESGVDLGVVELGVHARDSGPRRGGQNHLLVVAHQRFRGALGELGGRGGPGRPGRGVLCRQQQAECTSVSAILVKTLTVATQVLFQLYLKSLTHVCNKE